MKLCETCKKTNCNKSIVTIQEKDMITIKCIEYEKDEEKIKGYIESEVSRLTRKDMLNKEFI